MLTIPLNGRYYAYNPYNWKVFCLQSLSMEGIILIIALNGRYYAYNPFKWKVLCLQFL